MKNFIKSCGLYILNVGLFLIHIFCFNTFKNVNNEVGYVAIGKFILASIILIVTIGVINLIGYILFDYSKVCNTKNKNLKSSNKSEVNKSTMKTQKTLNDKIYDEHKFAISEKDKKNAEIIEIDNCEKDGTVDECFNAMPEDIIDDMVGFDKE